MAKRRYGLSYRSGGTRRYTLLYRRWKDLRNRLQGRATKRPDLYVGLELGWQTFAEFRKWALDNGFSKHRSSPDRQDSRLGYVPGNVVFETIAYNRARALETSGYGPEPEGYVCDYA